MRRFAWLVAVLAATLAAPASALADKSYTISQAAVNVTVARTGEVLMREDLTFSFDGFFTGAYRDIPLAQDVSASDVEVSEGGTAYSPGGDTTLGSSDTARHVRLRAAAAGPAHRLALPAGRRSADVHPALPPARRRDRPRRRGRGGPAGLGQPVEVRAPPAHGERARGRRAARHARLDRAGLAGPPPERAARRGACSRRRRAGAAQRDAARAVSALGARARRSLRRARARRHPAGHDRARAGRSRPRGARQARARGHAPPSVGLDHRGRAPGDRPGRAARGRRLLALRARASDRDGGEVRARAARRPGARARAVAARATSHRRRRPDGRDAVRARPPRALQDDSRHARGVDAAGPAPQGDRRRRPHAR